MSQTGAALSSSLAGARAYVDSDVWVQVRGFRCVGGRGLRCMGCGAWVQAGGWVQTPLVSLSAEEKPVCVMEETHRDKAPRPVAAMHRERIHDVVETPPVISRNQRTISGQSVATVTLNGQSADNQRAINRYSHTQRAISGQSAGNQSLQSHSTGNQRAISGKSTVNERSISGQ